MSNAVNSSSGTVIRKNRPNQAVRRLLDSSSKIVAKSRDITKEQTLFVSSRKNEVLTKEAGIVYYTKLGNVGEMVVW